jgi:hypothetical protein
LAGLPFPHWLNGDGGQDISRDKTAGQLVITHQSQGHPKAKMPHDIATLAHRHIHKDPDVNSVIKTNDKKDEVWSPVHKTDKIVLLWPGRIECLMNVIK